MSKLDLEFCYIDSPIGKLLLAGKNNMPQNNSRQNSADQNEVLHIISFSTGRAVRKPQENWVENRSGFSQTKQELAEYFAGERTQFTVKLETEGTEFQKQVWQELAKIPYGLTTTYGQMAKNIARPKASRAVGAANGANPIPIILPCHRVIGANKSLTGFAGGLPIKEFLLDLEQTVAPQAGHQHQLL